MFKIIAHVAKLTMFIYLFLRVNLTKPQQLHLANFIEGVLMMEGKKTLARITRVTLGGRHASSLADFFSQSPWDVHQAMEAFRSEAIRWVTRGCQPEKREKRKALPILISLDDSHTPKSASSKHFEPVEWFYDEKGYKHAVVFVSMHIRCGNRSMPLGFEIYLKRKTVKKLNRTQEGEKLQFRTKLGLCMDMLRSIQPYLPKENPVIILVDSWYASKDFIRFCLAQGWQVICGLRSNRSFRSRGACGAKSLSRHARRMRRECFHRTLVKTADGSRPYWVCLKKGTLKGIRREVGVIFSKKALGERRCAFFLCTDTTLSAKEALSFYSKRWDVELDYLYLKGRLGLGDFRVRSLEAIRRYFFLVFVALAYLRWRKQEEELPTIADALEKHRREQEVKLLRFFGERVLKIGSVERVLEEFFQKAA